MSTGPNLYSHFETEPLSPCLWTVGEQVDITCVKRREIDGVSESAGRGDSLTVMAEKETAGPVYTGPCVCMCVHISAACMHGCLYGDALCCS